MATLTPTSTAQRLAAGIAARRRWVVLAMLLTLHAALVASPGSEIQRVWLLVHFGLFLLWQPFIAAERELEIFSGAMLFGIVAVTLYFLAGWIIVAWLLILLGILGGRVFTVQAAQRNRFYLVAFAYVLASLRRTEAAAQSCWTPLPWEMVPAAAIVCAWPAAMPARQPLQLRGARPAAARSWLMSTC